MRAIGSRTVVLRRPVTRSRSLGRGPAAERQHQDVLDRHARPHPGDRRLDQGRGLAGAGTGQDQQRAARMLEHRPLRRIQTRLSDIRPRRP